MFSSHLPTPRAKLKINSLRSLKLWLRIANRRSFIAGSCFPTEFRRRRYSNSLAFRYLTYSKCAAVGLIRAGFMIDRRPLQFFRRYPTLRDVSKANSRSVYATDGAEHFGAERLADFAFEAALERVGEIDV